MTTEQTTTKLEELLRGDENISLCFLYGSARIEQQNFTSDIDVAVAGNKPLNAGQKQNLIEQLAMAFERPVDLVDLQETNGTLLHQILTKGKLIFCDDHPLYAQIMKRMLYNQSDFMPYHHRILKERRERWINE